MGSRDAATPTSGANTPSGMLRADSVPATHCTGVGSARVTHRASVVLHTPASPMMTMPQVPVLLTKESWMAVYSLSRCTTGQLRAVTSVIILSTSPFVGHVVVGTTDSVRMGVGERDQPLVASGRAHVYPQRA